MGMQTLSILIAEDPSVLLTDAFDSESLMLPLDLTAAASSSRLLGAKSGIPAPILADLTQRNVTTNLHHDGVAPEAFQENAKLAAFFTVVSTNKDRKGRVFVSTIEGKTAPVFGAQWHPERPQFEWAIAGARKDPINHSIQAVAAMQYMSNFFVAQARLNERTFATPAEEAAALIYNWQPVGTSSYQAFLFNPK
jgi:gamma-glutamyl hydrolase